MAAELGQSDDPTALIPGSPDSVHGTAGSFQVYGNMLHDAGAGLQRIDTTEGWQGSAGDAFRKVFHGQPGKWLTAGDCFHQASSALDDYAGTLSWAQQQASVAIQQWNAGQAATQAARAQHAQAVAQAQEEAAATGTTAPDVPFVDPGVALRDAAQQTLRRARDQLKTAAATANRTVGQARDQAPQKPGFWSKVGSALDSAWHDVENVGAETVNDLASIGNAAIHHPEDVAGMVGGALLTTISAAGEGGGLALDATGVGAIAGAPLNVVSAVGITAGVGLTGVSTANMMMHAAGDDHVEPLKTDSSGGSDEGSADTGPGQEVGRDDLSPSQQSNLNRYTKKLPAGAEDTKITQLDDGSVQFETKVPGRVPGSYALYTKTVSEDGTTIGYTKTTVTPDGSIAHVKDKLVP